MVLSDDAHVEMFDRMSHSRINMHSHHSVTTALKTMGISTFNLTNGEVLLTGQDMCYIVELFRSTLRDHCGVIDRPP